MSKQPRGRGRPKGKLGTPKREDLEALWCIYDLMESGVQNFGKAVSQLVEFANTPKIWTVQIKGYASRWTHSKRLRAWSKRYLRRKDIFSRLAATETPLADRCSPLACLADASIEGCHLTISPLPESELSNGRSGDI
jgi:hypothetical protein